VITMSAISVYVLGVIKFWETHVYVLGVTTFCKSDLSDVS
jgi:hypothetical protein